MNGLDRIHSMLDWIGLDVSKMHLVWIGQVFSSTWISFRLVLVDVDLNPLFLFRYEAINCHYSTRCDL
jgi:hypothetical protein